MREQTDVASSETVLVRADNELQLHGVVAKVLQECQNGVLSRVVMMDYTVGEASAADRIAADMDELEVYAKTVDAVVVRRAASLDLVVPRAIVTVETVSDAALVVAGHRRDPGSLTEEDGAVARLLARDTATVWELADAIAGLHGRWLDGATRSALREVLLRGGRLPATLSADVLNSAGEPAVPRFVVDHDTIRRSPDGGGPSVTAAFTEEWGARIDVDEYAFYEATHPAYGEQVRVMGHMIRRLAGAPARILDVGSGPGLPTLMLSELFPAAAIDAVEPSDTAFAHLSRVVVGSPIEPHHCEVTGFARDAGYPVVVSVGASHHLDTRVFLQSLHRLVEPGGLVVVADELICRFTDPADRANQLIAHHFRYIDEALAHVVPDSLPRVEQERLQRFRDADRTSAEGLRRLLVDVSRDRTPHRGATGPWQRVRFAVLELEALVAGIDYDVERKTYPHNFMAIARDAGLDVVDHRRIHATCGQSDMDAGTHVVALRRPSVTPRGDDDAATDR